MEVHVSVWVLLGGILLVENEVLKESLRWFVKSAEWEWKFAQPLECSHLTRLDNSKKRNFLFLFFFLSDSNFDDSGLTAYNHNLDTSREFYPSVRLPPLTSLTVTLEINRLLRPDLTMTDWIQSPQYAMLALVSALEVFLV